MEERQSDTEETHGEEADTPAETEGEGGEGTAGGYGGGEGGGGPEGPGSEGDSQATGNPDNAG